MDALSGIRYGSEIAGAARAHGLDPALLAAVAAQETGGPGSNSGANVVGDGGNLCFGARGAPQSEVLKPVIVGDDIGNAARGVVTERISLFVHQRAVVLDQTLEGLPRQIQPIERRIAAL